MKRFSLFSLLFLGIFAAALFLNACQKEVPQAAVQSIKDDASATNRSQVTYGVEVYTGAAASQIVELDNNTGNVNGTAPQAFYVDNNGNTINLDNIKGICLTSWGQYFLTTGNPANPTLGPTSIYNNALFKVDPASGQCSYASTGPNTVSDLEHDPQTLNFYGLLNNSNSIIEIVDNFNNYGTYNGPFAITGIAPGYTLKGLTLVRDNVFGMYFVGCATRTGSPIPAKLYEIPANGGAATFITDLDPVADMAGGHCGIGFDIDFEQLLINRGPFSPSIPGLNILKWQPPFALVSPTGNWGGLGFDFEDLTSDVQ